MKLGGSQRKGAKSTGERKARNIIILRKESQSLRIGIILRHHIYQFLMLPQ